MTIRRRVVVAGRVQGVFFRDSCRERASSEGVGGYVRNLPDGRVEASFEGERDAVERMVEWARQGPSQAEVDSAEVIEEEPRGEKSFSLR